MNSRYCKYYSNSLCTKSHAPRVCSRSHFMFSFLIEGKIEYKSCGEVIELVVQELIALRQETLDDLLTSNLEIASFVSILISNYEKDHG